MKYLEPIDTAFDPLDYPPPGPVGDYSQRPACIYVDSRTRPAPAVSIPDAPTATDAFRWLRARFGGRRFTWADVPEPVKSVALAHRDEPVGDLVVFWSGGIGRRAAFRIAYVTPDSGSPRGAALEAATDTGFAAWRCSIRAARMGRGDPRRPHDDPQARRLPQGRRRLRPRSRRHHRPLAAVQIHPGR
jgi:hypothetical protein